LNGYSYRVCSQIAVKANQSHFLLFIFLLAIGCVTNPAMAQECDSDIDCRIGYTLYMDFSYLIT